MTRPSWRGSCSRDGVALPAVLLLAAFLVAVSGWLLGHVRTEQEMARAGDHVDQARRTAAAGLEIAAAALGGVADWTVIAGLVVSVPCPLSDRAPVAIDAGAETVALQAQWDAASRWGRNTPRWQLAWQCDAAGVFGRWPARSAPPALLVWLADQPEADGVPDEDSDGRVMVHALAVGPGAARATASASVQRAGPGGQVSLAAWRDGPE
ncbi:MAG: hypothetical protein ACR2LU_08100 [Luteitalea sp.]